MADEPGFLRRGSAYRRALEQVDVRIAVSGIRGKSSTVRRLHDVFQERGYDTFAKVTGDEPYTLYNGEKEGIQRTGAEVTLYENRRLFTNAVERLAGTDLTRDSVAIFENHAITEYTMRVFNETFFRPDVVVIPNVRTDHTDTLGRTRRDIARSFARSIPAGAHVISGERNDVLHDYLAAEFEQRDVTISRVDVPERYGDLPGAESVFAINEVLAAVGEPALPEERVESLLGILQPSWTTLRDGSRVFHAAKVNDPESTELFRRLLAGDPSEAELVCPLVFLRGDRRGRTASFVDYINDLYDWECIDRLHVAGETARTFARRVDPPATVHNSERDSPAAVIDAVLAEGLPVVTMANTVHPYMRALVAELNDRTRADVDTVADTDPLPTSSGEPSEAAAANGDSEADAVARVALEADSPEGTLEVYRDRGDDWRWRLVHDNGNILADGTRGYPSYDAVATTLDRVAALVTETGITEADSNGDLDGARSAVDARLEVYEDGGEEWRWRLRNAEGNILADSGEAYASKRNARRGLESATRTLATADVEPER